ncbi:MAG: hypothetical protein A4E55_00366 [Pelotomaculum sp. PtaU1.Bin035]|nr:MAG: hypothetical protein A4E55_00366 [Pelotomaculum sp. PtaU1.Bin035]
MYFGISPQDKAAAVAKGKDNTRGYMETALACPGMWLDLDIRGAAHKSNKLPPTLDAAIALIKEFPLEPTVLVHSGHGLQAWWLFKELWVFDTPEERKEAQDLVQRFQMTMKSKAEAHGWEIDSTFDLARVLRLPGTFNRKLKPEPVRVLHDTPYRYVPYDFEEYLVDVSYISRQSGKKINPVGVLAGVPQGQRDITLFKYACRLRSKGMTREEADALVLQAAANCTPPFPEATAKEKVASAWKYEAGTNAEQILDRLPERPEDVFEPETLAALAQLKQARVGDYARLKQQLKGKVNLNDLERAVNEKLKESRRLHIVEPDEPVPLLEEILPDIPLKELRRPYQWSINENGIWQDTKRGPVCACAVPVILTKRLKNIDTGDEKVELGFYRDGKWNYVVANRSTIFNKTTIIQIGNKSLPVSSENAKDFVRYLSDLERENLNILPVIKSTSHMGWSGKYFLPGAEGNLLLDVEEGGMSSVAGGYRVNGTMEEWVKIVEPLRQHPIARFVLAAAFATPLLKILGQRVFIIHSWGASRGGKTAALKAALSVWGDPEDLIASFNATKVGLERLAAFYRDLPLGIDERQVVGDKLGFIESLVYMLGTGKGKARGAKGGGLQAWNFWRTIVITTGEEPLSTSASAAGIKTRALEIYGIPITDESLASKIHHETRNNFGTAGPAFMMKLLQELKADSSMVSDDYFIIEEKLKEWHGDKIASHRAAIALIILADYYASQWIFEIEQEEALNQAIKLSETILSQLESAKDVQDSNRAYEYFLGWYGINVSHFGKNPPGGQRFGLTDGEYAYIFPPAFEKALKDGGYSSQRILRDWAEEGLIKTETKAGKRRFKTRKYDPETSCQAYFVAVKLPEGHFEQSDL